jgi:N-acetylglucosamine-6-sulfatase
MKYRRGVALGLMGALLGWGFAATATAVAGPPNVVLLLLDDQDAFTPYWDAMPATASMVRDRGMNFRTAIAPTPICSPGRATLLSGRLAHNTGVFTLAGPYGPGNFTGQTGRTVATALHDRGYVTAHIGKTWGGDTIALNPGWDVWTALTGSHLYEGYNYQVIDQTSAGASSSYVGGQYSTDFISDHAVAFLHSRAGSPAPFFLWLSPTAPHLPLPPAPRHQATAKARWARKLPHSPNYNESNISDKSQWLRTSGAVRSGGVSYADGEYSKRMGSLMAVDEMMARIQGVLAAQGQWNNTLVIVTSDNGYNLGAHRLIHKMAPYEESIRIPMAVAGPGVAAGTTSRIVGLHDIAPTLIELAGGPPALDMDGRSLVPFLQQGDAAPIAWRGGLITEYMGGWIDPAYNPGGTVGRAYGLDIPTYRSLRTDRYKYIVWQATGEEEVFDLATDPYELTNLTRTNKTQANALLPSLRAIYQAIGGCAAGSCP